MLVYRNVINGFLLQKSNAQILRKSSPIFAHCKNTSTLLFLKSSAFSVLRYYYFTITQLIFFLVKKKKEKKEKAHHL